MRIGSIMKRFLLPILCLAVAAGCSSRGDRTQEQLDEFAPIQIGSSFVSGISDNGREVLNYFRLASGEVDNIYWDQNFGDKSQLNSLPRIQREFADVNYGPWSRIDGQTFVPGWKQERPLGANFYPADMSEEEFLAWEDPDKNSPYTLIRRGEDGSLKTVWYHDAYKARIEKINQYLMAAANYTIKPSVRQYLLAKMEALKTDDYFKSDTTWLSVQDSKMDLIMGPAETEDDRLRGVKTSYESYVLLKDLELPSTINNFAAMIPTFQSQLPCPEEYKVFEPGKGSTIYAYDMIYCAGAANAGVKKIAINRPYDLRAQEEHGTRTAVLNNVIHAKYIKIILPAGRLLITRDQSANLNGKAFFWNTVMREIAHGIGVKETVNGKGTVEEALGDEALTIEKIKDNALGLFLNLQSIASGQNDPMLRRNDALATFVISTIRSARFGDATALGRANIIIYNFLREKEAFSIDRTGHYLVDFDRAEQAITELASKVLTIQGSGDREAAGALIRNYGTASESLLLDFAAMKRARIPVDVRFQFVW